MPVSRLDPSQEIDHNNWATTLIRTEKKPHSMLIIEGLDERTNQVFTKFVHFKGPWRGPCTNEKANGRIGKFDCPIGFPKIGDVEVKLLINKKIRYSRKSETWIRSADKVNALLLEAEEEQNNPLTQPQAFNIFGRKSIFAPRVTAFKVTDPLLQGMYKENPRVLSKFYSFAKTQNTIKNYIIISAIIGCIGGVIGTLLPMVFVHTASLAVAGCLIGTIIGVFIGAIASLFIGLNHAKNLKQVKSLFIQHAVKDKRFSDPSDWSKCRDQFMRILVNGMEEVSLQPDNCLTWARRKLRKIDVELESKNLDYLIAMTRMYTAA